MKRILEKIWRKFSRVKWKDLLRAFAHGIGLSCLAGAVFLEILVFKDIFLQGAFVGLEPNPVILSIECFVVVPISVIYLGFLYYKRMTETSR